MRYRHPAVSFFVVTSILLLLLAGSVSAAKFGKVSDEEWEMGPPQDYPEANAVIIFTNGDFDIKRDKVTFKRHVRIKVLTEAGVDDAGDWSFWYNEDDDKVKNFKAHTITPDGEKHKVEKDAVFEKTVGGSIKKTFSFPQVSPGCIIEFKYEIRSKRFYWLRPWYFQNRLYTLSSTVSALLEPGFSYDFDFRHVDPRYREPDVENLPNPNQTFGQMTPIKKFSWTLTNLPPVDDEPYMSCVEDYRASVRFQLTGYQTTTSTYSYFKNWTQWGEEMDHVLDNYCNEEGDIERLAKQVTAGAVNDKEQSRLIYEYVSTNFANTEDYEYRYRAHEEIGDMLKEMRGAPEEKNYLLVKMHRAVDIPAFPVLISTRDHARFNPRFPSIRWFNYLIASVQFGNEWEFLDAGNLHVPYGLLPTNCLTDGGLLLDGGNSELVRITIKPTESYRIDVTDMYVAPDGAVSCTTNTRFGGYLASGYGELFDNTKPKEFTEDHFVKKLGCNYVLGKHDCHLDTSGCFCVKLDFTSDNLTRQLDENVMVKPVTYAFRTNPFKSKERHFPVDFAFPRTYRNIVRVFPQGGVNDPIMPPDTTITAAGLTYERTSVVDGGAIVVTTAITIDRPEFPPPVYSGIRSFFDKVALASEDEIALLVSTDE